MSPAKDERDAGPLGPSSNPGQLNRDNVNPNIPPAERPRPEGPPAGGTTERGYDPRNPNNPDTLKSINEPNAPAGVESAGTDGVLESINEPPGSDVTVQGVDTGGNQPAASEPTPPELPEDAELHKLRRDELDELAMQRGVDISEAGNKDDVIELLKKDERRRKRNR